MVQVLCSELRVQCIEWSDDMWDGSQGDNGSAFFQERTTMVRLETLIR
jgi:hypothetical protein